MEIALCHDPAPFLARFGLKARATVRVEEDTGSVPRSPSGSRGLRARTGSDPATGGWSEPPVRTFWQVLQTQELAISRKPLRRECRMFRRTCSPTSRAFCFPQDCGFVEPRASPAPSILRGQRLEPNLGQIMPREHRVMFPALSRLA